PIQHKTSGFYYLIEFKADPEFVANLEIQYKRDERILRFLTVALDKDAIAYAEHRREMKAAKKNAPVEAPAEEAKAEDVDDVTEYDVEPVDSKEE
ncbi:MAG: 30S ribosomal protein S6, partial [Bacteroidales bacterium]|nr:30S ribosomal protein S6 [Bacteroidales bacterium]